MSLVCIFLLYTLKQITTFWLYIEIKNIYSEVNIKKKKKKKSLDAPIPLRPIPNRACPLPYDLQ